MAGMFCKERIMKASLLLITLLFLFNGHPSKAMEMTFGTSDIEVFPYHLGEGVMIADPPGLCVDIILEATKKIGVEAKFTRYPDPRVLTSLKKGIIDGALIYSYNEDRLKFGQYPMKNGKLDESRKVNVISYNLYKLKSDPLNWDGNKITGINGREIGINSGNSIAYDLGEMGIAVAPVKTTDQNLMKLKRGHIAGFAHNESYIVYSDHYQKDIMERIEIPLKTKSYYVLLSHQFVKKHPEIAEELWDTVGQIREHVTAERLPFYLEYHRKLLSDK